MRFARRAAIFLCVIITAASFRPALAAEISNPSLAQYAAELNQKTSLEYFKPENTGRYIEYRTLHPDLDWETVVTYVNIGLDRLFYSDTAVVSDPAAPNVLVNKYNALPADYVPAGLETINPKYSAGTLRLTHDARVALERLCADAKKLGFSIYALSAYRSYSGQKAIYDSFFDPGNPETAVYQELRAARPGYSEHQTGLAVDIARSGGALAGSAVYEWYSANAYKYGFIVRYPYAMESVLGYSYEPWHLRYLGVELATAVYESGLTYDEYYARVIDVPERDGETYAVGVTTADSVLAYGVLFPLSTYNVQGASYFRLRDIAAVLNGTPMQFDITWDEETGRIALVSGAPYSGDPALPAVEAGIAVSLAAVSPELEVDGQVLMPPGYVADGSTYYLLGDILAMLGAHAEFAGGECAVIVPGPAPGVTPSMPPSLPPYIPSQGG